MMTYAKNFLLAFLAVVGSVGLAFAEPAAKQSSKGSRVSGAATSKTLLAQAETNPPSGLPGGASSLEETFQDWRVLCNVADGKKRCVMRQQQVDPQSRLQILAAELGAKGDGAEGFLLLPFGLDLEKGAVLTIDDGEAGSPLRFRTCLQVGCVVSIAFDAATLVLLKKGGALKIAVAADGGNAPALAVSLKGFSAAFDRVAELSR